MLVVCVCFFFGLWPFELYRYGLILRNILLELLILFLFGGLRDVLLVVVLFLFVGL